MKETRSKRWREGGVRREKQTKLLVQQVSISARDDAETYVNKSHFTGS